MRTGRKTKAILREIMQCKADGICARDKLVTQWVRGRMITNNATREAVVEEMRQRMELPECPPICPKEECENE
jgi:hypothetical protein